MTDATVERIRELLAYDHGSGLFTWKIKTSNRVKAGMVAGYQCLCGYIIISIDGRRYLAHRLVWLYVTSEWPSEDIDHRNGNTSDNRWMNLRLATPSQNGGNSRTHRNNTSGFKGVNRFRNGKFQASIHLNGRKRHLGTFNTAGAAHHAYCAAASELFGQFARTE